MTADEKQTIRSETIRELDAKYNAMVAVKIDAALDQMDKRIKELEQINQYNADSIRRGMTRNHKLQAVVDAAAYCYRNGHIDEAAVLFSGLDKAFQVLEENNGTGKNN